MKNYARPVIEVDEQLAEGVYLSLSGDAQLVAINEALDAATGEVEIAGNTNAANLTLIAGDSNGSGGSTEGLNTGGSANDVSATGEGSGTQDTGSMTGSDTNMAASGTETPNTQDTMSNMESTNTQDTASAGGEEVGEENLGLPGSMLINCDSKYMNGVWQGPKEGSWGGMKLGCKDVLGCKDCPADKGNGCGLQDANAVSLYFRKIGTLMPGWEASGKMPTDSPYGI